MCNEERRTRAGPRAPRIRRCSRTRTSVDGLRDAGRLERMAVINQLPRWVQLARRGAEYRRGISGTERDFVVFRRLWLLSSSSSSSVTFASSFSSSVSSSSSRPNLPARPNNPDPLTSLARSDRVPGQINDRTSPDRNDTAGGHDPGAGQTRVIIHESPHRHFPHPLPPPTSSEN